MNVHIDAVVVEQDIARVVLKLDAWLDSMRGPDGYSGPVVHWWQNCLHFTGAGLDWRYEGIITGYLNLFTRTGAQHWLAKARRAGDDLVRGQMATGNFRNSCFELNPYPGGTPHEAACDIGLLRLAQTLKANHEPDWAVYHDAAARNIHAFYLEQLWDGQARAFRDHPTIPSFVPNKSATLVEALILLAEISGDGALVEQYAVPALDRICEHQLQHGDLDGAIYQYSQDGQPIAWFFPYYIARCVPGLIAGYEWTQDERYLDSAQRALAFVLRTRREDGSFPQVIYPHRQVNRFPQWIAAAGDILHAAACLRPYGLEADLTATLDWMLAGQSPGGGFRTAHGFASQITQRPPGPVPDLRDILPVCGWVDKAWRYLTGVLPADSMPEDGPSDDIFYEQGCVFRNRRLRYREDATTVRVFDAQRPVYEWVKGTPWPSTCDPLLYLK